MEGCCTIHPSGTGSQRSWEIIHNTGIGAKIATGPGRKADANRLITSWLSLNVTAVWLVLWSLRFMRKTRIVDHDKEYKRWVTINKYKYDMTQIWKIIEQPVAWHKHIQIYIYELTSLPIAIANPNSPISIYLLLRRLGPSFEWNKGYKRVHRFSGEGEYPIAKNLSGFCNSTQRRRDEFHIDGTRCGCISRRRRRCCCWFYGWFLSPFNDWGVTSSRLIIVVVEFSY